MFFHITQEKKTSTNQPLENKYCAFQFEEGSLQITDAALDLINKEKRMANPYDLPPGLTWDFSGEIPTLTVDESDQALNIIDRLKAKHALSNEQISALQEARQEARERGENKGLTEGAYYGLIDTILSNRHLAKEDKAAQIECVTKIEFTTDWQNFVNQQFTSQSTQATGAVQFYHHEMDVSKVPQDIDHENKPSEALLWRHLVTQAPTKRGAIHAYVEAYNKYSNTGLQDQCYHQSVVHDWAKKIPKANVLEALENGGDITQLKQLMKHLIQDSISEEAAFKSYAEFKAKYQQPSITRQKIANTYYGQNPVKKTAGKLTNHIKYLVENNFIPQALEQLQRQGIMEDKQRDDILAKSKSSQPALVQQFLEDNKHLLKGKVTDPFNDEKRAWKVQHRIPALAAGQDNISDESEQFQIIAQIAPQNSDKALAYWQTQVAKQYQYLRGHLAFKTGDDNFIASSPDTKKAFLNACELPYGGVNKPVWETCTEKADYRVHMPGTLFTDCVFGQQTGGPLRTHLKTRRMLLEVAVRGMKHNTPADCLNTLFDYQDISSTHYEELGSTISGLGSGVVGTGIRFVASIFNAYIPKGIESNETITSGLVANLADNLLITMGVKQNLGLMRCRAKLMEVFTKLLTEGLEARKTLEIFVPKITALVETLSQHPECYEDYVAFNEDPFKAAIECSRLGELMGTSTWIDKSPILITKDAYPAMVANASWLCQIPGLDKYNKVKSTDAAKNLRDKGDFELWENQETLAFFLTVIKRNDCRSAILQNYKTWVGMVDAYGEESKQKILETLKDKGYLTEDQATQETRRLDAVEKGTCPIEILDNQSLKHMAPFVDQCLAGAWKTDGDKKFNKAMALVDRFGKRIPASIMEVINTMEEGSADLFNTEENFKQFLTNVQSLSSSMFRELCKGITSIKSFDLLLRAYHQCPGGPQDKLSVLPSLKAKIAKDPKIAVEALISEVAPFLTILAEKPAYAGLLRPLLSRQEDDPVEFFKAHIQPLMDALGYDPALLTMALQDYNQNPSNLDKPLSHYLDEIITNHHADDKRQRLIALMRFYRQKARGADSIKGLNTASNETITSLVEWHKTPPYCSLAHAEQKKYDSNTKALYDVHLQESPWAMTYILQQIAVQDKKTFESDETLVMFNALQKQLNALQKQLIDDQEEDTEVLKQRFKSALETKGDATALDAKWQRLSSILTILGRSAVQGKPGEYEGQSLNSAQIVAVMRMIERPEAQANLLAQINTGQGKSRICAVLSAYFALEGKGRVVDYFTSYALGQRWVNEYAEFFELLGIRYQCVNSDTPTGDLYQQGPAIRVSDEQLWLKQQARRLEGKGVTTDVLMADEGDLLLRQEPVYSMVEKDNMPFDKDVFNQVWRWFEDPNNQQDVTTLETQWREGQAWDGEIVAKIDGLKNLDEQVKNELLESLFTYKERKVQYVAMPVEKGEDCTSFAIDGHLHTLRVLDNGVSRKQLDNYHTQWMWANYWQDTERKEVFTCPEFVNERQRFMRPTYDNTFYLTGSAADTGSSETMVQIPTENRRGYAVCSTLSQVQWDSLQQVITDHFSAKGEQGALWTNHETDELIAMIEHDSNLNDEMIDSINGYRTQAMALKTPPLWREEDTLVAVDDDQYFQQILAKVQAAKERNNPCLIVLEHEADMQAMQALLKEENLWDDSDWYLDAKTNATLTSEEKKKRTNKEHAGSAGAITLSTAGEAGRGFDIQPADGTRLEVVCGMRNSVLSKAVQQQVHGRTRRGTEQGLVTVVVSNDITLAKGKDGTITQESLAERQAERLVGQQLTNRLNQLQTFWRDKFTGLGELKAPAKAFPSWPGIDCENNKHYQYFTEVKAWLNEDLTGILTQIKVTSDNVEKAKGIIDQYEHDMTGLLKEIRGSYEKVYQANDKRFQLTNAQKEAKQSKRKEQLQQNKEQLQQNLASYRKTIKEKTVLRTLLYVFTTLLIGAMSVLSLYGYLAQPIIGVLTSPPFFVALTSLLLILFIVSTVVLITPTITESKNIKAKQKALNDIGEVIEAINPLPKEVALQMSETPMSEPPSIAELKEQVLREEKLQAQKEKMQQLASIQAKIDKLMDKKDAADKTRQTLKETWMAMHRSPSEEEYLDDKGKQKKRKLSKPQENFYEYIRYNTGWAAFKKPSTEYRNGQWVDRSKMDPTPSKVLVLADKDTWQTYKKTVTTYKQTEALRQSLDIELSNANKEFQVLTQEITALASQLKSEKNDDASTGSPASVKGHGTEGLSPTPEGGSGTGGGLSPASNRPTGVPASSLQSVASLLSVIPDDDHDKKTTDTHPPHSSPPS